MQSGREVVVSCSSALLALLVAATVSADDHVYVANHSPARFYSFTFDGTSFTAQDLDPALSGNGVGGGVGVSQVGDFAATDHLFLHPTEFQNVGLNVIDPFNRVELPRVKSQNAYSTVALAPDERFAYLAGVDTSFVARLGVVDLRPDQPTYLTEIASISMGGETLPALLNIMDVVVAPNGKLYVALFGAAPQGGSWGFTTRVKVWDLSTPSAPILLHTTDVPMSGNEENIGAYTETMSVNAAQLGGADYLIVNRFDAQIVPILPSGDLNIASIVDTGGFNTGDLMIYDTYAVDTSSGPRLFCAANRYETVGYTTVAIDVLVVDLAGAKKGQLEFSAPASTITRQWLAGSPSYLYYLHAGERSGAKPELMALTLSDTPTVVQTTPIDGAVTPRTTTVVVRSAMSAPAALTITGGSVDGPGAPNVLENGGVRTVTLAGSGLDAVTHVFSGLQRLTVATVSGGQVTAKSPSGLATGNRPLVLVDGNGAIARFDGIRVADPVSYTPAYVVIGGSNGENRLYAFNAATDSTAVPVEETGAGPGRAVASGNGRRLFVSNFLGGSVSVHTLVPDGDSPYKKIVDIETGGSPQGMAMFETSRGRLYVTLLDSRVAIIDTQALTLLGTFEPSVVIGLPKFFNIRGIAVDQAGRYLYLATAGRNARPPELLGIDVEDDDITPSDVTTNPLTSPPGVTGGADIILNVATTKLYYIHSLETAVRIFDVNGASLSQVATIPIPGATTNKRQLAILPDGRFLYVVSRGGTVDIFDLATNTRVQSLTVGSFADKPVASPDSQYVYVPVGESDEVLTIDARPSSLTLHQVIARAAGANGGLAVAPGPSTPSGNGVALETASGMGVTFSSVTTDGNTSVTSANITSVARGIGYQDVTAIPVIYRLTTTAGFAGGIDVCLGYDDSALTPADENNLRLLHEEDGRFVDRTRSVDAGTNTICGAIAYPSQLKVALVRETSICSTLAAPRRGRMDTDVFRFSAVARESVALTLKGPKSLGARVEVNRKRAAGPLPLEVTTQLGESGFYQVSVSGRPESGTRLARYCLLLRSTAGAYTTLAAQSSVE